MIEDLLESDLEINPNPMPIRLRPAWLLERGFIKLPTGVYVFPLEDKPLKKSWLELSERLSLANMFTIYSYVATRVIERPRATTLTHEYDYLLNTTHEVNVLVSYLQSMIDT